MPKELYITPYNYKKLTSNKYVLQMPSICGIPKLLHVDQWEMYANIYATYKPTGINHVTRSTVHT